MPPAAGLCHGTSRAAAEQEKPATIAGGGLGFRTSMASGATTTVSRHWVTGSLLSAHSCGRFVLRADATLALADVSDVTSRDRFPGLFEGSPHLSRCSLSSGRTAPRPEPRHAFGP